MNIEINFGLFADSLTEQLKDYLPKEIAQKYDDIAKFLMSAHLDGKLTDKQEHKLFDYLVSRIQKEISKKKVENK